MNKRIIWIGLLCFSYVCGITAATRLEKKWRQRADSLIAVMTLEEKIGQLNMLTGNWEATGPVLQDVDKEKQLRSGRIGAMLNVKGSHNTRTLQEIALQSRLRIPILFGQDVIHGYKTIFPIPLAQAASFDSEAMESAARVAARESAVSGIHWMFSPMLDVSRDPRWGRVMEGPGEDPYLAQQMACALIKGYQTPFEDGLFEIACAKHFAAYSGAIGGRDYNTVDISMQTLHNLYLPPFRTAVENGVGSMMCSFNEINGIPSSANKYLYDLLYKDWKFDGLVVSDWGSIREMVVHGYSKDRKEAAKQAINAGVTIDMESYCYSEYLEELLKEGAVSMKTLDDAVRRVLMMKFRLGLFEHPFRYCDEAREQEEVFSEENRRMARDVARKSIILLKNENQMLPLNKVPQKIALIGPLANSKRDMDGNWVMLSNDPKATTLYEALCSRYPQSEILCIDGCTITGMDQSGFSKAEQAARDADLVILALGESWDMSGEARSRGDISLPGVQEELACRIYEVNHNTVTMLMAGRPMIVERIVEHAPAIVWCWWLGTEAGHAMTDVLTGEYNPSARVPMSFPKHLGQLPVYYNRKNSGRPPLDVEGNYSGRYLDIDYKPRYSFGYGLSYTTFAYSDIKMIPLADSVKISFILTNTGKYDGRELAQVYVHKLWGETTRPVKELKAFRQVFLKKGESRTVELVIPYSQLEYYGADGWQNGDGEYSILMGRDASDCFFEQKLQIQRR